MTTARRWVCLWPLMLLACDTGTPEHPDDHRHAETPAATPPEASDPHHTDPDPAPSPASDPAEPSSGPRMSARTPPSADVTLVQVRNRGDVVEIEVELPRPLPPTGASRPSLQVGDEVTRRSRAGASGRLDRLVFTVPAEQYARMSRDADIIVRTGLFSNEASRAKPQLQEAE